MNYLTMRLCLGNGQAETGELFSVHFHLGHLAQDCVESTCKEGIKARESGSSSAVSLFPPLPPPCSGGATEC